jgi:hypothetical protein
MESSVANDQWPKSGATPVRTLMISKSADRVPLLLPVSGLHEAAQPLRHLPVADNLTGHLTATVSCTVSAPPTIKVCFGISFLA